MTRNHPETVSMKESVQIFDDGDLRNYQAIAKVCAP